MAIDQLASFKIAPKQAPIALDAGTGRATVSPAEWAESFTISNPTAANLYLQTQATLGSGTGIIIEPGRNASFAGPGGNNLYLEGTPGGTVVVTWHDEA